MRTQIPAVKTTDDNFYNVTASMYKYNNWWKAVALTSSGRSLDAVIHALESFDGAIGPENL